MRTLLLEEERERNIRRREAAEYMVSYEAVYRTIGLSPFIRTILSYRQLILEKIQREKD